MADSKKEDPSSIDKILIAAEKIFAEKGFDGARVDEIAKRAGVNKALIYYYFESKEQILEELAKKHIQEIIEQKEIMFKDMLGSVEEVNRANFGKIIETSLWTLLGNRKDFLGIVMIEAIKHHSDNTAFFKLINQLYDDSIVRLNKAGYQIDNASFKTIAFFYGIIPVIMFMIMGEKWAEFNQVDPDKVNAAFIDALAEIEFSMFINKFNLNVDQKLYDNLYHEKFNLDLDKKS